MEFTERNLGPPQPFAPGYGAGVFRQPARLRGPHGQNFVRTMLRLGRERFELAVVDDQRGCPTAAADIADALIVMAARIAAAGPSETDTLFGTFHFCGMGQTSWYGFAREIFAISCRHGHAVPRLRPITTVDYPTPAARPKNSVLDCSHLRAVYGNTAPLWQTSLEHCVARLCEASLGAAA